MKSTKNVRSFSATSKGPIFACIDLGTNSFHMIVCQALPEHDHFDIIVRAKEAVPFFRRALSEHYIDDAAMRAAVKIVKEMIKKAQDKGATLIVAVATSAVRESKNGSEFLTHLRGELDIDAKMISGKEEARLIYLGVLWSMPELKKRFAIVDIGGGSCELIVGDRNQTYFSESYKLGAARLTQRFFRKNLPDKESIEKLHEEISGVLRPASAKIANSGGFEKLIGTSGTVQAIAKIDREWCGKPDSDLHNWKIPIERLEQIVSFIEKAALTGEKIKLVSQDRSQTILAGAIVLLETMRSCNAKEIIVCTAALREGVIVDHFLQSGWLDCDLDTHRNPRSQAVLSLLEKYHGDFEHAASVTNLALEIFRQTRNSLHQYSLEQGELLWASAMLHDVGMFIGRNGHHKHSFYLIRHAGLLGYSEEELEIIANIARYHRGSEPKSSHESFMSMPIKTRQLISDLASILRLAEALDRSHKQIVTALTVKIKALKQGDQDKQQVILELALPIGENAAPELWALEEKKSLFESQFKVSVSAEVRIGKIASIY